MIQSTLIFIPNYKRVNCEANTWCCCWRGRQQYCSVSVVLHSHMYMNSLRVKMWEQMPELCLSHLARLLLFLQNDKLNRVLRFFFFFPLGWFVKGPSSLEQVESRWKILYLSRSGIFCSEWWNCKWKPGEKALQRAWVVTHFVGLAAFHFGVLTLMHKFIKCVLFLLPINSPLPRGISSLFCWGQCLS